MTPNVSERGSHEERKLPSTHPELNLPARWRTRYEELRNSDEYWRDGKFLQTEALRQISRESGGVPLSTLRYHVIESDKSKQLKNKTIARQNPTPKDIEMKRVYNREEAKRTYVKRHLGQVLDEVFGLVDYTPQNLRSISDLIYQAHSVHIKPSTIYRRNEEHHRDKGYWLLVPVKSVGEPRYLPYSRAYPPPQA